MSAAKLDLRIEQGATFSREVVWKDSDGVVVDLTGYTARMQLREYLDSSSAFVEMTTGNGRITITAEEGKLALEIPASVTGGITQESGYYDLEVESSSGVVTRLLQGRVTIDGNVTR